MDRKISEQILQETINYLVRQPFAEVAGIITALSNLPKIEVPEPTKEEKSEQKK